MENEYFCFLPLPILIVMLAATFKSRFGDKFMYQHAVKAPDEMCKKDYPDILEELEKEPFRDLLDAGCGPAPMISLLSEKYPDRHYTGLDLTPAMIEQAKKKNIPNATFVVGDCENFPFKNNSFDAIICSMSFHHYPNPQAFFDSVKRCLRPNGRLLLRDVTSDNKVLVWLMNCCRKAGLKVEKFEIRKGMRMHCVVRKQ